MADEQVKAGKAAVGPEDRELSDFGRIILGQKPIFALDWQPRATMGAGVKSPKEVGPSANWYQLALMLCAITRFERALPSFRYVLSAANDWKQGEFDVDDRHDLFHFYAFVGQRRAFREMGRLDDAKIADGQVMQWLAMAACGCDQLKDPRRTKFGWAHQRTKIPLGDDGKSDIHYIWKRGLGISHLGTGFGKAATTPADNQAPFCMKLFCDAYEKEIRNDVGRIIAAYKAGGFPLVSRWIVRGGRPNSYHWVRFANGGVLTVQETDCGIDDMRSVVLRQAAGSPLIQFPDGLVPRQQSADDWAKLDVVAGTVNAYYKLGALTAKVFKWAFDPKSIVLHIQANPAGVMHLVELDGGPQVLEWEPEGGLPALDDDGAPGEQTPGGFPPGGSSPEPGAPSPILPKVAGGGLAGAGGCGSAGGIEAAAYFVVVVAFLIALAAIWDLRGPIRATFRNWLERLGLSGPRGGIV